MIHDVLAEFCDATSVVQAVGGPTTRGNQIPFNVVDNALSNPGVAIIYWVITVATSIDADVAGTIQFTLVSADDALLTANPTTHLATPAFATATTPVAPLTAGSVLFVSPIPSQETYRGFLGIRETVGVATADINAGAINSFLTDAPDAWTPYATRRSDPNP